MKDWMMKCFIEVIEDHNLNDEPEDVFMERMKKLAAENPLLDLAKKR